MQCYPVIHQPTITIFFKDIQQDYTDLYVQVIANSTLITTKPSSMVSWLSASTNVGERR